MKNLIITLITIPLIFSSCQKCKECESDLYHYTYTEMSDSFGNTIYLSDSVKRPHWEVCRDDFDSKDDYEDYIDFVEDDGYDCKSDFWN